MFETWTNSQNTKKSTEPTEVSQSGDEDDGIVISTNRTSMHSLTTQEIIQNELEQQLKKLSIDPQLNVLRDPLANIVNKIFRSIDSSSVPTSRSNSNNNNDAELQQLRLEVIAFIKTINIYF